MPKAHVVDFSRATDISELALCLGTTVDLLKQIVASATRKEFYCEHRIPKRSKHRRDQFRVVWEATDATLVDAHKALHRRFEDFARSVEQRYPHPNAFGFLRGRSIRANAARHCGSKWLLRTDLSNFFPTISFGRLLALFRAMKVKQEVAFALAKFVTVDDCLAQGLHASPLLANLICLALDEKLATLASLHRCQYSRYADDLAFSSDEVVPTRTALASIVQSEGFVLSEQKFRITKLGQAHFVTGLSVSDSRGPHVPYRYKHRLRQELYYCKKFGITGHLGRINSPSYESGLNRLDGTVRFVTNVEPTLRLLRADWENMLTRDNMALSHAPRFERPPRKVWFFVDETEIARANRHFLALACVAVEEVDAVREATLSTLRRHKADPFSGSRKHKLDSKGLHFADVSEDLRTDYATQLAFLPVRAFIAFDELDDRKKYAELYGVLFRKLLSRRFLTYDRAEVQIVVEENSQLSANELTRISDELFAELERRNDRRPALKPSVVIGHKRSEACLAVPDTLLGVLGAFVQSSQEHIRLRFERLRDRYKLIFDCRTGRAYSRRNPFDPMVLDTEPQKES